MAIKVRALDSNLDRTFGKGKANFIDKDDAITQNVKTRIKSFKNDFFLNLDANIDWFTILGQKNNENIVKDEIERVTLSTEGVINVTAINIVELENREASIEIYFDTIYSESLQTELSVGV